MFEDLCAVHVQGVIDSNHLAVVQLQPVLQHTREEVQLRFAGRGRRGQPVNPIPNVQQQKHDGRGRVELASLCVRLVDLLHGAAEQVAVEAEAVAEHLDVGYFDVDLPLVGVCQIHGARVIAEAGRDLGAAA